MILATKNSAETPNFNFVLVHNPLIISANEPPMIQFKTISKHIVISIHKKKEKRGWELHIVYLPKVKKRISYIVPNLILQLIKLCVNIMDSCWFLMPLFYLCRLFQKWILNRSWRWRSTKDQDLGTMTMRFKLRRGNIFKAVDNIGSEGEGKVMKKENVVGYHWNPLHHCQGHHQSPCGFQIWFSILSMLRKDPLWDECFNDNKLLRSKL